MLHCQYATRWEAEADVIEYIQKFYNSTRKHLDLGYVSPNDDEAFFT
jgi:putative transposase